MSKDLEDLAYIKNQLPFYDETGFKLEIDESDFKTIENELKEGEKDHELKVEICEYFGLDDLFPFNDNSKIMEKLKETQSHYYDIQFKKSKKEKALEIIKGINFDIVYREQFDEWTLFVVITTQDGEHLEPITFGSGKEEYDLLKEVLL